jgi:hypothetical protein
MPEEITRPRGRMTADDLAKTMLQEAVASSETETAPAVSVDDKNKEDSRTPLERWSDAIKQAGLTREEAIEVIDAQIDPGFWVKTYTLYGGRVKLVFRTRSVAHRTMLMRELDLLQNASQLVTGQLIGRFNLVNSLQTYEDKKRKKTFTFPVGTTEPETAERMFQERNTFVLREIPDGILDAIYSQLSDFDKKVAAALSEGAVESF